MKRLLSLVLALVIVSGADAGNWSHWRGPEQNGVSRDTGLPDSFSIGKEPKNVLWRAPHGGRSTPLIQNGRVYIINKVGEGINEQERVQCFDADKGTLLHEHKFNVWLTDIVSSRLGWTNLAGDPQTGRVYAHGTQGLFFCFDKDLKIVWQHSLTEEFGRITGYGGRVTSPIVDGDLVLMGFINSAWGYNAVGRNRFFAFDKNNGKVVWCTSTGFPVKDTYYSNPVVANIGGERLLVSGGGDGGVHAFKVRTGEKVWSYIFASGMVNCSPVVSGDLVYIGHGEENIGTSTQGMVLCVNGAKVAKGSPELVWKVEQIKAKYASPILHQGRLYIADEVANLYCLDAKDGKEIWQYQYGKNAKGSPVLADGKIYAPEVDSKFHILVPGTDKCEEPSRAVFFRSKTPGDDVLLNGSPAVANGRVYFMTTAELFCLGTDSGKEGNVPEQPREPAAGTKAAFVQVFPSEVALIPGESVELEARTYDDKGRLIGKAKAEWSLAPTRLPEGLPPPAAGSPTPPVLAGELSASSGETTKVTVAKAPPGQYGEVLAKIGDLVGRARVRVVPRFPYAPDFTKIPLGRTPAGWVNTQGKFVTVKLGDKQVLMKTNTNPSPLVAKANGFIGLPSDTNYTIEADVMATKVDGDLPEMGIVANRYNLSLWGNTQQVRLTSWDAIPRVDKSLAFAWKPEVWYRFRLTVETDGKKAVIRGKVWERDGKEPADWTVEFTDTNPNTEGSPALFGSASGIANGKPGTAIYYDNVKVTTNKK